MLTLTSAMGSLVVAADAEGVGDWCQVELLEAEGQRHRLGAERLEYVLQHLRSFLADQWPGQRWVMTFAERHHSVYGEHVADVVRLDFQDSHAQSVARLVLTPDERDVWAKELARH